MMESGFLLYVNQQYYQNYRFCFTRNYIEINDESYILTHRTANGMKMAPTYTKIFFLNFEERLLDNCTDKPFLYYVHVYIYHMYYVVENTYLIIIPRIGYDIITQSSQCDTLIQCRIKKTINN